MRSYVIARMVLGLALGASPALADDKLEKPSAPADAPAAPSVPSGPAASSSPNAPATTPAASTTVAKSEAKSDPLVNLPAKCAPIAKRMATPTTTQAMAARISLAGCLADERLAPLKLLDTQESMLEVEAAIAPSLALLDDVIARGDAQNELLAHHAKMLIVQQGATRMLASVPPAAQPTVEAAQLRDSRRAIVESMIAPWRAQIIDEATAANAIAKANPKLEKNGSVAIALRDTRKMIPEAIATAEPAPAPTARPSASQAGTAEGTLR